VRDSDTRATADLQQFRSENIENFKALATESSKIGTEVSKVTTVQEKAAQLRARQETLDWISTLDYESNLHAARSHSDGIPGTGKWLFDKPQFRSWMDCTLEARGILLHGIR